MSVFNQHPISTVPLQMNENHKFTAVETGSTLFINITWLLSVLCFQERPLFEDIVNKMRRPFSDCVNARASPSVTTLF